MEEVTFVRGLGGEEGVWKAKKRGLKGKLLSTAGVGDWDMCDDGT